MLTKIMSKFGWTRVAKPITRNMTDPQAIADIIGKSLAGIAGVAGVRIHAVNTKSGEVRSSDVVATSSAVLQPPIGQPHGGWAEYRDAMERAALPGWTFGWMGCQQHGESAEQIGVSYFIGNLKDDFGIFTLNIPVCYPVEIESGGEDEREMEPVLANLVHLPSGVGLGVFETRQLAAQAAEVIEKSGVFVPQQPIPFESWMSRRENIHTAWRFAGIGECPSRHCHPYGIQEHGVPIMIAIAQDADRPEKLS